MLYETLIVIAGPFFKFTIVEMKGPNKTIKPLRLSNLTLTVLICFNDLFCSQSK